MCILRAVLDVVCDDGDIAEVQCGIYLVHEVERCRLWGAKNMAVSPKTKTPYLVDMQGKNKRKRTEGLVVSVSCWP